MASDELVGTVCLFVFYLDAAQILSLHRQGVVWNNVIGVVDFHAWKILHDVCIPALTCVNIAAHGVRGCERADACSNWVHVTEKPFCVPKNTLVFYSL